MSACCGANGKRPVQTGVCPHCDRKGRAVDPLTVKALLQPAALARLENAPYSFCPTPSCPVVYFATKGESLYHTGDLKVRIGVKDTEDPVPICYCFGHTRTSAWKEIQLSGRSTVLQAITEHVQAGRCACEVNNPSGKCCLGEVNRVVKEGFVRFGGSAGEPKALVADDCCAEPTTRASVVSCSMVTGGSG